jgi:hypothetical protein
MQKRKKKTNKKVKIEELKVAIEKTNKKSKNKGGLTSAKLKI